jgi:Ca-activated chloride channel family protein
MNGFRFFEPWWLLVLAIAVLVAWWRPRRGGADFAPYPLLAGLRDSTGPAIQRMLFALAIAGMAVALARPQFGRTVEEREQAGRDLMIVVDTSRSMSIDDIVNASGPNSDRLAAVFLASKAFIAARPDDRIGLVFFGNTAVTTCPPTYDHQTVDEFLDRTEAQQRANWALGPQSQGFLGDGTNIGLGLGYALKDITTKSHPLGKAIILVTDGADSLDLPNWVDPIRVAKDAAALGAKIYGIGVGDPNGTHTETDLFGRTIRVRTTGGLLPDLDRLAAITQASGGTSFAATDRPALDTCLKKIDDLEPTPHLRRFHDDFADRFAWPLAIGLIALALALASEPRLRGVA